MRLILITVIAAALTATSVSATPRNQNTNVNHQGQVQGQIQGQVQGQHQGQGQNQSVSNGVNVEGSAGVSVGGSNCAAGVGLGIPGAGSLGVSWSVTNCRILAEAQALYAMGFRDLALAHLTQIDRVADTVRSVQGAGATVVSTSSPAAVAPRVALEVTCAWNGEAIVPQVTQAVMDAYSTEEIMDVCR
jgi:hypothetical protein